MIANFRDSTYLKKKNFCKISTYLLFTGLIENNNNNKKTNKKQASLHINTLSTLGLCVGTAIAVSATLSDCQVQQIFS